MDQRIKDPDNDVRNVVLGSVAEFAAKIQVHLSVYGRVEVAEALQVLLKHTSMNSPVLILKIASGLIALMQLFLHLRTLSACPLFFSKRLPV